jgi:hypothetical protein
LQGSPKVTEIGIFALKIYHLATMIYVISFWRFDVENQVAECQRTERHVAEPTNLRNDKLSKQQIDESRAVEMSNCRTNHCTERYTAEIQNADGFFAPDYILSML